MKTKFRVLSVIMTVAMILSSLVIVVPTSVSAATTDANLWTDYAAAAFAGGKGTSDEPYQIANAEQLALLAKLVNTMAKDDTNNGGKRYRELHYLVTADIDATAHQWVPIANVYQDDSATATLNGDATAGVYIRFNGTFDGGNHTITTVINDKTNQAGSTSNAYSGSAMGGLFGAMKEKAVVKNVRLNHTVALAALPKTGVNFYGGLSGIIFGSEIQNCHVTLNATGNIAQSVTMGGFTGYTNSTDTTFENCTVSGTVNATTATYAANAVTKLGNLTFGGFIGRANANGTSQYIKNCANYLNVTVSGGIHVDTLGGLIGIVQGTKNDKFNITNFVNAGSVTFNPASNTNLPCLKLGGLIGSTTATLENIYVDGFVNICDWKFFALNNSQNAGVGNLIGNCNSPENTVISVANAYSVNQEIVDVYNYTGTATLGETTMEADKTYDGVLANFTLDTLVEGTTTKISMPKAAYAVLDAVSDVTVGRGTASIATYAEDSNGNVVFTVDAVDGIAFVKLAFADAKTFTLNANWSLFGVKPAKGTGAETDPYIITTPAELAYITAIWKNYANKNLAYEYWKLGADIDLSGKEWYSIGAYEVYFAKKDLRFQGKLDGAGKTISNLTMTTLTPGNVPTGLFGATKSATQICNLNLTGSINKTISVSSHIAGIGMVVGGFASGTTVIDNVHVNADIDVSFSGFNQPHVAGFVSYGNNVVIKNSTMSGSINLTAKSNHQPIAAGFIANTAGDDEINGCVNYADVYVTAGTSNSFAGGFVGITSGTPSVDYANHIEIYNCVNYGDVTMAGTPNNQRLGGIIGQVNRGGKASVLINGCANFGTISIAEGVTLGGSSGVNDLVGWNEANGQTIRTDIPYALTIANVLNLKEAVTENVYSLKNLGYKVYTIDPANPDDRTKDFAVTKAGNGAQAFTGEEYYFEVNTVEKNNVATISASKIALDIFVGANYKMELVYNGKTISNLSAATASANGLAYEWTISGEDYKAGATATLKVTDPLGAASAIKAGKGTWAGLYAATELVDADEDGYYDISSGADFGLVARLVNKASTNATYRAIKMELVNDIDLGDAEFETISQSHNGNYRFDGALIGTKADGGSYTISNLRLTNDSYVYTKAMFGQTNGTFKDINFRSPKVGNSGITVDTNVPTAAVLAGSLYGANGIDNVHVYDLDYTIMGACQYYGGLVGYLGNANAYVRNSSVQGVIKGVRGANTYNIGGIASRARYGTIENCHTDIKFDLDFGVISGGGAVGAIVGQIDGDNNTEKSTIINNTSTGSIHVDITGSDAKGGWMALSGIVGRTATKGQHVITGNATDVVFSYTNKGTDQIVSGAVLGVNYAHVSDGTNAAVLPVVSDNYSLTGTKLIGQANETLDTTDNTVWTVGVTTDEKAAVRIDKNALENSGLRFDSYINTALYNAMKADTNVTVEIGTLSAPPALFASFTAEQLDKQGIAVKVPYMVEDYAAAGNGVGGFAAVSGENSYFTGAITGIKDYSMKFTAVAYVTVTINGTDFTFYADYANEEDRSRSIYEVADLAYKDRLAAAGVSDKGIEYYTYVAEDGNYSCYSLAQLAILKAYLGLA
ncbi:MAG: hypothetical protein IJW16_05120 [Clostridia bacterium]|nr:hypothetical protein [Clostridia bacterium]